MHDLTIMGTWFRRLNIHRHTWISHYGVTKKEVDHILTRSLDKSLFLSCRTRRGAEAPANTDHVIVTSEMRIAPYKP